MVDGVILLVDAAEGAMPQTKFVTGKALALGLRPIVVVNKVDRPTRASRKCWTRCSICSSAWKRMTSSSISPCSSPSGRNGYASEDADAREGTLTPLFQKIVDHVPAPSADPDGPFKFLVTLLDRDNFLGRILTGLVFSGSVKTNMPIHALDHDGKVVETGRASKIMAFRGLERVPADEANAGDIISLAGLTAATVANTICDPSVTEPLHAQAIDPPTLSMRFAVNDSPMAGREGTKVTSRMIRDRLFREAESNVAIKVTEAADRDSYEVAGRGELQLGVLIETMRREGFELGISRPRVLFGEDENGSKTEPYETVIIDVDEEYSGTVVEKMNHPQGRDDRHAPFGRRQDPHHLQRAIARDDRLSWRIPVGHARHRHHEPAVREIRPAQGQDRRPQERRADLQRHRAKPTPMRSARSRSAASCSSAAWRGAVRRHDHRRERQDGRP